VIPVDSQVRHAQLGLTCTLEILIAGLFGKRFVSSKNAYMRHANRDIFTMAGAEFHVQEVFLSMSHGGVRKDLSNIFGGRGARRNSDID
jgi:hypothetical protein